MNASGDFTAVDCNMQASGVTSGNLMKLTDSAGACMRPRGQALEHLYASVESIDVGAMAKGYGCLQLSSCCYCSVHILHDCL